MDMTLRRLVTAAGALLLLGLPALPSEALAQLGGLLPPPQNNPQPVRGSAGAVQATVLGVTASLVNTGALSQSNSSLDAAQTTGAVPSLVSGESLYASAISWTDEVDSESGISNLGVTVGSAGIAADEVLAQATSSLTNGSSGSSAISGLSINGQPVAVTGAPNQTVAIPGGQMVINEQIPSSNGITVNALHISVAGADVVIGSATAGISR